MEVKGTPSDNVRETDKINLDDDVVSVVIREAPPKLRDNLLVHSQQTEGYHNSYVSSSTPT